MAPETSYRPFPPFAQWAEHPVDLKYWEQALAELQALRQRATPEQIEEAARYVTRATAVDTAAIEGLYTVDRGFTLSVAAQAGAWESAFEEKGRDARRHFEAQLQAFELVLDAATRQLPVVEALIRSLHEHVCAAQETYKVLTPQGWQEQELVRGEYKRFSNNPYRADGQLVLAYAPVEEVRGEMERLVVELDSEAFAQVPAPIQAAFAHYAFVSIHPFPDGNGRVARALASIYLVRATSVPFLLFADEKPAYLGALEAADRGSYREMIEQVRDRSIGAMNFMALALKGAKTPKAGELRDRSWRLHWATPELTHEQVDVLAKRLLEDAGKSFRDAFALLGMPKQIDLSLELVHGDSHSPTEGYRRPDGRLPLRLEIRLESPRPALGQAGASLRPLVALDHLHPLPVRIEEQYRSEYLDAGLQELYPEMSQGLEARLRLWAETIVRRMAEEAIRGGWSSLERSGWKS